MSDYIEFKDKIAFHPGYYIRELVEESGLTQEDFAKRMDTTPKNLSILIRGDQSLSVDIALKLSRMTGSSVKYWLNLQNEYDSLIAEFHSEKELQREREVFACLNYGYFRDHFGLENLPRKVDEQIRQVREFLNVATLSVLKKRDMAVSFRSAAQNMEEASVIKANAMVQIAANETLKTDAPKFDKEKFKKAVNYAVMLTKKHSEFYPLIREAFLSAGVVFVILPNLSGSKINGATKKIGNHVMLMVNDRRLYADSFWFTLFHEIGHIMNGSYGISFDSETGEQEEIADRYAENMLIPQEAYQEFLEKKQFDIDAIKSFAAQIGRDPGIVLGRLQNDGKVKYNDWSLNPLRHKYRVKTVF